MLSLFLQWSCFSTKAHEACLPHRMALGSQLSLHPLLAPLCRGDSEKGKGKVTQSFFFCLQLPGAGIASSGLLSRKCGTDKSCPLRNWAFLICKCSVKESKQTSPSAGNYQTNVFPPLTLLPSSSLPFKCRKFCLLYLIKRRRGKDMYWIMVKLLSSTSRPFSVDVLH